MTKHYTDSKGQPVEIAGMLYPHLLNARDKLIREQIHPEHRKAEIDAMAARLADMDAEIVEVTQ